MKQSKSVSKYESNPFKVIFSGFSRLFKYNQNLAIIILVLSLLGSFNGTYDTHDGSLFNSLSLSGGEIAAIVILGVLLFFVIVVLGTYYNGSVAYVAYKTSQSQKTTLKETLRKVSDKFWTILGIEIIVLLKVIGGLILFIVPGIRALLRYDMVLFPVFDENAKAKTAIERSKSITKDHLLEIFGMSVASGIIPFVGQVMHYGGQSVMYPQLKQLKDSGADKPPVHWLNYLGFVIIGAFLMLVATIVSLFMAFGN